MADFATRLRELRKNNNLRQVDLAKELGVAQTTIANYEQHSRFPDEDSLRRIATFFDASLDYLLGRTKLNVPLGQLLALTNSAPPLSPLANAYMAFLLDGEKDQAFETILQNVRDGLSVREVYKSVLEPTLKEVGRLWENNTINVATEHYFSAATETLMGLLYPYFERPKEKLGKAIAIAVGGELHEIGIKMVADFLEEAGWECFYLGVNTPTENLWGAIVERNADVLAISVTMAHGVDGAGNMIEHIRSAERRSNRNPIRIITGGRAFSFDTGLWKRIGADGFAQSAEEAVELVSNLAKRKQAS